MDITLVMGGVHLHMCMCTHVDVSPFPYLGNGRTDCAEIWYVVTDPLARLFAQVNGGAQLYVRTPFCCISETAGQIVLKFGTYVFRDLLAKHFTKVDVR